jgi:hypothetical protein
MKKNLLLLTIFFSVIAYGQAPNQINYQGIARNAVGNVIPGKNISVRLSIHEGNATGTIVYSEIRNVTTSNFGLFNIAIGSAGAASVTGTISDVNWGAGAKFLQVEIDPAGGSNFLDLGAAQLLSVPYALFSGNSTNSSPSGTAGGELSGSYPNPTIANGVITNSRLADNSVSTSKIQDGSVTATKLAAGVIPTSLPPTGLAGGDLVGSSYPNPVVSKIQGVTVTTTGATSGQVLKFNGSGWAPGIDNGGSGGSPTGPAGGDLAGSTYPNPIIANGVVNNLKLADNSVSTSKIQDAAVTTIKLADASVTTAKLADNSVSTSKIIDGSVTTAKIVDGSVSYVKLGTAGATNGQVLKFNGTNWAPGTDNTGSGGSPTGPAGGDLAGSTYPNPIIANGVVNNLKLADNSVSTSKIQDAAVTTVKLADASVTSTKLADNSVSTTKILDGSVTASKIAAGTSLPPNGLAGGDLGGSYPNPTLSKIQGVTVNTAGLTAGQVLKFDGTNWVPGTDIVGTGGGPTGSAGGDLSGNYPDPNIASNAVTTPKINNGAVITPKIADGAVTYAKLGTAGATLGQVLKFDGTNWAPGTDNTGSGGGSPTGPAGGDLTGSTYPNPIIANGVISNSKLADNSVSTLKIQDAAVTTAKLADASVTNVKLADNSVSTSKIQDAAVTTAKLADASVTNVKLADNSVSTSKIQDVAVTTAKLADASVTNVKLADNSVTTTKILDGSVTALKIAGGGATTGQVLKYNGTQWAPGTDNSSAFSVPYSTTAANSLNLISVSNSGSGAGLEGINSSTNANAFGVVGRLSSTSPGNLSAAVRGINNGTVYNGIGVWGSHSGSGMGVYGTSNGGAGVQGTSTNYAGVFGSSDNYISGYFDIANNSNGFDAISANTVGTGNAIYAHSDQGNGVWGITFSPYAAGIFGLNVGGGEAVVGQTSSSTSAAVVGKNSGNYFTGTGGTGVLAISNADGSINGDALVATLESGPGNLAVFKVGTTNMARIDGTGKGYFNGGTQNSGADVAEAFDVEGERKDYEPGDVLIISQNSDRKLEKSSAPYSTLVAGVFATKPGVLLTEKNAEQDQLEQMVPMGVIGVIPTKVCIEGGPIKRGDLIVTSSLPGVAMKADPDKVKVGQVIGKALQDYNAETVGMIKVLVSIK